MPFKRNDDGDTSTITSESAVVTEVFIDAAHGLFDVLARGSNIRGDSRQEIVIQADTMSALFLAWLLELMDRVTQMGMLYSDFEVFSIQQAGARQYVLTGAVYGEALDASRHTVATGIALNEKSAKCIQGKNAHTCSFQLVRK